MEQEMLFPEEHGRLTCETLRSMPCMPEHAALLPDCIKTAHPRHNRACAVTCPQVGCSHTLPLRPGSRSDVVPPPSTLGQIMHSTARVASANQPC